MNTSEARARLLQAYLNVDALNLQLKSAQDEIRDLRNYIAGAEQAREEDKVETATP